MTSQSSVPKGKELAERTFNPRLGIVGGISILGTSGIVEPMSSQALIDTIRVELRQRYSFGYDYVAVAPGNYGLDFMKESYGYDLTGVSNAPTLSVKQLIWQQIWALRGCF